MMNIHAPSGHYVIVTSDGLGHGTEEDIAHARQYLQVGHIYCVDHTVVYKYRTKVYLQEFPGVAFNSVHFEDATHDRPILPQFHPN